MFNVDSKCQAGGRCHQAQGSASSASIKPSQEAIVAGQSCDQRHCRERVMNQDPKTFRNIEQEVDRVLRNCGPLPPGLNSTEDVKQIVLIQGFYSVVSGKWMPKDTEHLLSIYRLRTRSRWFDSCRKNLKSSHIGLSGIEVARGVPFDANIVFEDWIEAALRGEPMLRSIWVLFQMGFNYLQISKALGITVRQLRAFRECLEKKLRS